MVCESVQPAFTHGDLAAFAAAGVALIAASGSWIATWRSNKNSREQLERQLQHASDQLQLQLQHTADQRERERAMSLRRDVYLPAVEAIIRSQGALGKMGNPDSDVNEIAQQMIADQATMAKIHMVGSERTVTALMNYVNTLMPAYMELGSLRVPLIARRRAINSEQSLLDRTQAVQQQNLELMRQFNIAGKKDQAEFQRLKQQFDMAQALIQQHEGKIAALWNEQNAEVLRVVGRVSELAARVSALIPDAVIAARQELELPIDAALYRRLFADQHQVAQRAMQQLVENLNPKRQAPPPPPPPPQP